MNEEIKQGNWIYIIDEDFKIVYTNLDNQNANALINKPCYKAICGEQSQCSKCPLRKENDGTSILFDKFCNEWVNVSSSKIEWDGKENCHLILCNSVKNSEKNYLTNNKSEYSELLKINYLKDELHVVYHGQRKFPNGKNEYSIKEAVGQVAIDKIYEEDRERFYQFWCLDEVGKVGVPRAYKSSRHGEFRKYNDDGTISWIQQILMPVSQTSKNDVFVMSYYNQMYQPELVEENLSHHSNKTLNNIKEFYHKVEENIQSSSDDFIPCVVSIDIEKFNLFNEWYGREAGDQLLDSICSCLEKLQDDVCGLAADFGEDDFAFYMEDNEAHIRLLCSSIKQVIDQHSGKMNVLPAFGIYRIEDKKVPAYKMYDRAKLACSAVKGNYITRVKRFEFKMLEVIQSEYLLLTDIQNAFQNKEFYFVLQPKCDMTSGQIVGAEALARWYNSDRGNISPGIFIPFLEKTGLVTELDTYIWESVCSYQRETLDKGEDIVPISINISRIDISSIDVPNHFKELIKKYQLDPKWIELEITESAYSENAGAMNYIVKELRSQGFRVLMDDFGSAYSSLNMLKDIEVDEIKVDMRFLHFNESNQDRGADILETVCNMAQVLGLDIIAEGVETNEQKELLLVSGCNRGQGYYFYRPIGIDEFKNELKKVKEYPQITTPEFSELFNLKFLLNKNILSQNMLMNMLGAMAFYEIKDRQIKIVRYNDKYAEMLGYNSSNTKDSMIVEELMFSEDEYNQIYDVFMEAQKNRHSGASLDVHRKRPDGIGMWLHMRVYFLYQRDGRSIFYSNVSDVTKIHHTNLALRFLNNDMPGGYYRCLNNETAEFTYISQRFLDIFGYTRQEIKELFDDKFMNMVHPEDREMVTQTVLMTSKTYGNYSMPCRMRSKNGYIFVLDQSRLVKYENLVVFQGIIITDVDHFMWLNSDATNSNQKNQATTLMPCGVFQVDADTLQFSYISNSMLHMLGYSRHDFEKKFNNSLMNLVYSEDIKRVKSELEEQLKKSIYISCEYRIELADKSLMWVYSQSRLVTDPNGKRWFYTCIVDYSYLKEKYRIQEWQFMKYKSLTEIPGYFVYDYDLDTDKFTIDMTEKNGQQGNIVIEHFLENFNNGDIVAQEFINEQRKILKEAMNEPTSNVTEFKAKFVENHELEWYRFNYISLADEAGKVYRIVGRGKNINEEKERILNLQQQAMKDSLTSLLNYESAKHISSDILSDHQYGILYLFDLDNFKEVNDTLGHLEGDKLLIHFAKILKTIFENDAIIARFGGDEFIVFIPNPLRHEEITQKAEMLLKEVSAIQLPNAVSIGVSIGITSIDTSMITFEELFQKADEALYESKRKGKNCYTFNAHD